MTLTRTSPALGGSICEVLVEYTVASRSRRKPNSDGSQTTTSGRVLKAAAFQSGFYRIRISIMFVKDKE